MKYLLDRADSARCNVRGEGGFGGVLQISFFVVGGEFWTEYVGQMSGVVRLLRRLLTLKCSLLHRLPRFSLLVGLRLPFDPHRSTLH